MKNELELCNVIKLYIILVILNESNLCTSGTIRTKLKGNGLNIDVSTLFTQLDCLEKEGYLKITMSRINRVTQKKQYSVLSKGFRLVKDHNTTMSSLLRTIDLLQIKDMQHYA